MRFLYFFGIVFLLLFSHAQTRAQVVVPVPAASPEALNLDNSLWDGCAHGHICCSAGCYCCGELHREQVYDTLVAPEVRGIKRYTIIERYDLARTHAKGSVQYVFKNAEGKTIASYYSIREAQSFFIPSKSGQRTKATDAYVDFKKGPTLVHNGDCDYSLVDETGRELPISFHSSVFFSKGFRKVSLIVNGRRVYGIADLHGMKWSPLKYETIGPLKNGIARVETHLFERGEFTERRYGFINSHGKEIIPCVYTETRSFINGVCAVSNDSGWTLIDSRQHDLLKTTYDNIQEQTEGLYAVSKNEQCGFIDVRGKVIVSLEYEDVLPFSDGLAAVMKNEKWGFIDHTGKVVIPLIYGEVKEFSEGLAPVGIGNTNHCHWGIIDKTGKVIREPFYNELYPFKGGYAKASVNGQGSGYVNREGKETIPCNYNSDSYGSSSTWFLHDRVVLQGLRGRGYFLADKEGREVLSLKEYADVQMIPWVWENFTGQHYLLVRSHANKFGLVDLTGKLLIPCIYDGMNMASDSLLFVYKDKQMGVITFSGEVLIPLQYNAMLSVFEDGLAKVKAHNGEQFYINRNNERITEY